MVFICNSSRFGAIPIIALQPGVDASAYLPLSEVLDWSKAVFIISTKGLEVGMTLNIQSVFSGLS